MPPPNLSLLTATNIPSLPFATSQADIRPTDTVWYKYIGRPGETVIGEMFFGSGGYTPDVDVYVDNDLKLLKTITANRMGQTPIVNGKVYYYAVKPGGAMGALSTLNVDMVKAPFTNLLTGTIFTLYGVGIESFQKAGFWGLPAAGINPASGLIISSSQFSFSKSGDYLPTGELLVEYSTFPPPATAKPFQLRLWGRNFSTIHIPSYIWTGKPPVIRTSREFSKFLVWINVDPPVSPPVYFTVNKDNVLVGPTPVPAVAGDISAIANHHQDTFIYLARNTGAVDRLQKSNGVVTSFITALPTHLVTDILVMKLGEIVVCHNNLATGAISVRVYSPFGFLLRTYTPPPLPYSTVYPPRLGYANDDSLSFWVYLSVYDAPGLNSYNRFQRIQLSDVSVLGDVSTPNLGYFDFAHGAAPVHRIVTGVGGPFLLILSDATSPDLSGLYFLNPLKAQKHDSYYQRGAATTSDVEKKIPDPTLKSALLGE